MNVVHRLTRYLFFTGKGGVGKTSLASATAIQLADQGKRVLLVSTDPASNLEHVFGIDVGSSITTLPEVHNLFLLNIDPEAAARAYRERVLTPMREVASADAIQAMEEQLSGACTVEIAAFDEFTGLLLDSGRAARFDHVIFDTAPTGHTLRLLNLPAAWSSFIDANPRGASCLGPSSALRSQRNHYALAVAALQDSERTTFALVARPEGGSLREASRTSDELAELGLRNQLLIVNGQFVARDRGDRVAVALEARGSRALQSLPLPLAKLPRAVVPLRSFNMVGVPALRALLDDRSDEAIATGPGKNDAPDLENLDALIDEIALADHGVIMVMGKGGVGKTTVAAAIAVGLADRQKSVTLSTTDPAAHVAATIEQLVPNLEVGRIDPAEETRAYKERVLAIRTQGVTAEERAVIEEDLESPCTEEVAVFHAFSRIVSRGRSQFVVLDTAPTGHTLLLLDTTGAYHHEIMRSLSSRNGTGSAVTPMMRLRDAGLTRMILITLPESTPVQEATDLQDDLKRAGIEPYAWVINGSLAAAGAGDPLLKARAAEELPLIEQVEEELSTRSFLIPWMAEEPIGPARLRALSRSRQPDLVPV